MVRNHGVADKNARLHRLVSRSCVVTFRSALGVGSHVDPSPKHALSACGNADEGHPFNIGELSQRQAIDIVRIHIPYRQHGHHYLARSCLGGYQ
jgi:hypothetical protein